MRPVAHPKDNGRALAERAIRHIEDAVFQVLGAGEGRLEIEIRQVARDRVRLIVTAGATKVTTLAATDLGARLLARADPPHADPLSAKADAAHATAEMPDAGLRPRSPPEPTPQLAAGPRRYLTAKEVGRRYGISDHAVRQRRRRGQLPPPLVLGRRHLWDEADLDRFDDLHKVHHPARPIRLHRDHQGG